MTDPKPFSMIDISSTRKCGDCSVCCKLLPTIDVTPWNERCKHQRMTGCKIYETRPLACRLFTCAWLSGTDNDGLRRPDRGHYVVSTMPDYIEIRNNDAGQRETIPVIEVWIDPKFPDAHKDAGLREYLARRADNGFLTLIRLSPSDAFVMFAPQKNSTGEWQEERGECASEHARAEKLFETIGPEMRAFAEGTLEKAFP